MSSETPSTNVIKACTSCFTWILYIWRGLKSGIMVSEKADVDPEGPAWPYETSIRHRYLQFY